MALWTSNLPTGQAGLRARGSFGSRDSLRSRVRKTPPLPRRASVLTSSPPPGFFWALEEPPPGANGEIQITDAIQRLLESEPVYACAFEGARYDTGSLVGYLRASVALALQRPELAAQVREALAALLDEPS